jgi:hypothetical protein
VAWRALPCRARVHDRPRATAYGWASPPPGRAHWSARWLGLGLGRTFSRRSPVSRRIRLDWRRDVHRRGISGVRGGRAGGRRTVATASRASAHLGNSRGCSLDRLRGVRHTFGFCSVASSRTPDHKRADHGDRWRHKHAVANHRCSPRCGVATPCHQQRLQHQRTRARRLAAISDEFPRSAPCACRVFPRVGWQHAAPYDSILG